MSHILGGLGNTPRDAIRATFHMNKKTLCNCLFNSSKISSKECTSFNAIGIFEIASNVCYFWSRATVVLLRQSFKTAAEVASGIKIQSSSLPSLKDFTKGSEAMRQRMMESVNRLRHREQVVKLTECSQKVSFLKDDIHRNCYSTFDIGLLCNARFIGLGKISVLLSLHDKVKFTVGWIHEFEVCKQYLDNSLLN